KELCEENRIALRYVWYYEDPYVIIPEHLRELGLIDYASSGYTVQRKKIIFSLDAKLRACENADLYRVWVNAWQAIYIWT
ncbi:14218_t:CDS:2, partial [Funneliformis geosporum]